MSEEKKPEIEFALTPEQKIEAANVLNNLMMSPFTHFSDDEWELNNGYPFTVRITSISGMILIPLTDTQIIAVLNQVMNGMKERQAIIGEILADVTA